MILKGQFSDLLYLTPSDTLVICAHIVRLWHLKHLLSIVIKAKTVSFQNNLLITHCRQFSLGPFPL